MIRRTTIKIDQELLNRAKKALGERTTRGAVEEALRRTLESVQAEHSVRAARQRRYLDELNRYVDVEVLGSEERSR